MTAIETQSISKALSLLAAKAYRPDDQQWTVRGEERVSPRYSRRPIFRSQRSARRRLIGNILDLEQGIRQHKAAGTPNPALLAELEAKLVQLKAELEKTPE